MPQLHQLNFESNCNIEVLTNRPERITAVRLIPGNKQGEREDKKYTFGGVSYKWLLFQKAPKAVIDVVAERVEDNQLERVSIEIPIRYNGLGRRTANVTITMPAIQKPALPPVGELFETTIKSCVEAECQGVE